MRPQSGVGRPGAEADERQRAGGEDDGADVDRRLDDDRAERVGHDVPREDRAVADADGAGGVDERPLAQRDREAPGDARVPRPPGDGERDRGVLEARSERRHDRHREQQRRERQEEVGDAHDHAVEPAAPVARDGAERHPDERRDADDEQRDDERRAGAEDDPAEDVAAELSRCRTECCAARRQDALRDVDDAGAVARVRREPRAEERREHDEQR